jgi:20S proteasome alpha/beta subunit
MTAIVAVQTPEGYILAADGRQTTPGPITNDETIKIYHSSTRNSEVAWAFQALNGGCLFAVEILQAVT